MDKKEKCFGSNIEKFREQKRVGGSPIVYYLSGKDRKSTYSGFRWRTGSRFLHTTKWKDVKLSE